MTGTITERVKRGLAFLAVGMAGFVLGVGTAISMVSVPLFGEYPKWVPRAEFLGWVGVAGVGLSALAWMYVDYRYAVVADT